MIIANVETKRSELKKTAQLLLDGLFNYGGEGATPYTTTRFSHQLKMELLHK